MLNKIKKDFTMMSILLIPVAVAINVVGGQITNVLKLPVYLDTIGTILISCIAGPWVGAVAASLSTLFNSIFRPQALPFIITAMSIAILTGVLSRKGMFKSFIKTIISGIILAFVSVIISAPIVVFVFGGVTGAGTSIITGALLATGHKLITSVFSVGIIFGIVDKTVSSLIAFYIIKNMSSRYLSKFLYGDIYI